ncbi:MAG: hypothetical protein ACI9DC_005590 [Gammaproteobacteria bacterium]|jgi:hypothetical protein
MDDLLQNSNDSDAIVTTMPASGDVSDAGGARALTQLRHSVFWSYSHADKDTEWYKVVVQYLGQLSIGGDLEMWDDSSIELGADGYAVIEKQLRIAKAVVILVTPTFLTSKCIADEAVPKLLARQEMEGLVCSGIVNLAAQQ